MSDWHLHLRTLCGKPPIRFYEKVLVLDSAGDAEIGGQHGWMLGVAADDEYIYQYQIHVVGREMGFTVRPEDVEGTGELAPAGMFHSAPAVRVRVDEEGRGHIVD